MFPWNKLPPELKSMVSSEIFQDCERLKSQHILSKCASVCRTWQHTWEPYNFSELVLTPSCLPMFRNALRGENQYRFEYLKLIWLRIELDEYDCSVCQTAEDEEIIKKNSIIFTTAVWSLLKILSAWRNTKGQPLADEMDKPGLELEISVHSPSDCKHVFRSLPMQDNYPYVRWNESRILEPESEQALRRWHAQETVAIHDPQHGWNEGVHTIPNPSGNLAGNPSGRDRLFGTRSLDFDFLQTWPRFSSNNGRLPRVDIVRDFTVRRAYFRGFSANVLFKLLHESFTHIQRVRVERWLHIYTDQQMEFEQDFTELLRHKGLPKTLKSLDLIEEYNPRLYPGTVSHSPHHRTLSLELARATRHLERVFLTWQADAETFFYEQLPSFLHGSSPSSLAAAPWENLVELSLTCSVFTPGRRRAQQEVLRSACAAVRLMPQLETLNIWNCGSGSAAFFEFDLNDEEAQGPKVLWMSTWDSRFSPQDETFQSWGQLARERDPAGREPQVSVSMLHTLTQQEMEAPWGVLKFLLVGEELLHSLSLFQVRRETESGVNS